MKLLQICAAGLTAALFAVSGVSAQPKDWSSIKIATEGAYKPWNFTDPSGKRVNRITGEEVVGSAAPDAWSVVTPQTIQAIAQKSSNSLASWLAQQASGSAAVASAAPSATLPSWLRDRIPLPL